MKYETLGIERRREKGNFPVQDRKLEKLKI